MKIVVDKDRCIGAGQCVRVADELFDQSEDDGIVLLLNENPPAESEEAAREAVQLCPSQAIWIAAEVGRS